MPAWPVWPVTRARLGEPALRQAISPLAAAPLPPWQLDPATQISCRSTVLARRLFALAQTVIDPTREPNATVVCPNPFYQIYEGAALLAGADTWFAPSDPARNFAVDWAAVPDAMCGPKPNCCLSAPRATRPAR